MEGTRCLTIRSSTGSKQLDDLASNYQLVTWSAGRIKRGATTLIVLRLELVHIESGLNVEYTIRITRRRSDVSCR